MSNLAWIDRDFPLTLPYGPIPTVEMTFQETVRMDLQGGNDSKANWETLLTNQFGIGFQHFGAYNFRFISAAYHSLHCLYTAQEDFERPDHAGNPSHHFNHCLIYMWQLFLCNADMTLEEGDFLTRNYTTERVGTTRKCRDWTTVADYVDKNNKDWLTFNGVSIKY